MHPMALLKRLTFLGISICLTASGCQSVTTRGQGSIDDTASAYQQQAGMSPAAANGIGPPPSISQSAKPASELPAPADFAAAPPMHGAPSELRKSTLPTYVVAPPDILLIDAMKLVPKPPYLIQPLDVLQVVVVGTLLGQDIAGQFAVSPSGTIDLGPAYGKVTIAGKSVDDARRTIDKHLRRILREPEVSVVLAQSAGVQQIAGEKIVGPDGTVNLGTYGSVYVAGLTLAEVKDAIEAQLSKTLLDPRVSVDVFAYNSKVFYIVSQGAGLGDGITRVPITGNETVLDAIAQVNGLSRLASKKIWIARPTPGSRKCEQILPVNWNEITSSAGSATNYQILPGDRVFIAENKLIALDALMTKLTAPAERLFGFAFLGGQSIATFNNFPFGYQGGNFF